MAAAPPRSGSPAPVAAALLMLIGTTALFLHLRAMKPAPSPVHAPQPAAVTSATVETIGHSVQGRPILCHIFGTGPRTLFIKASIHGTEGAGTPITGRLIQWLDANPDAWKHCRILVMPVANPDGLAALKRFNANGVDLNRNFPAGNREDKARFGYTALSEPESQALHNFILRSQPDVIVAIHQPLNCVDYDGPVPAGALAARLSSTTGLPVEKLGARPGSLGAWFGETLQRPILTLELPRSLTEDPDKLWSTYGPGLIDLIQHPETWTLPPALP